MNSWNGIGRLTKDPELVETTGGTSICNMRIAVDRRNRDEGAVYLDVKCFEGQARACADHLEKGRQVAVSGRLELDEWEAKDGSGKRSRLYVIGERVEFLAKAKHTDAEQRFTPETAVPADDDGEPADEGNDDDIPFD